ncbi:MAG: hypothetical protein EOL88_04765 [Bacteroidia bacterium]|nr:hypothetical protein [Bacteroidia bacterium]
MKKKIFMMMDFSDPIAGEAYKHCIRPVCEHLELVIIRADEILGVNPIYEDIIREIQHASILIADISTKNPNVFYELGIAHTLKQGQTLIITHEQCDKLPFDIRHFRVIEYENSIQGTKIFEEKLRQTLEALLQNHKAVYQEEFELVLSVLVADGKEGDVFALIGMFKSTGFIRRDEIISVEATFPNGTVTQNNFQSTNPLAAFVKLNYVTIIDNRLMITEKGKAFAEHAMGKGKGYNCHILNGITIAENYKSMFSKSKESQSDDKQ